MGNGIRKMKTYLSVGIGDMMCLDSILTQSEKLDITEIYWGCRFGIDISPLMANNPFYSIKKQYFIEDETGKKMMNSLYPEKSQELFWHFRPDFEPNYTIGKNLLSIKENDVFPIDASKLFQDPSRTYQGSSFLMNATMEDVNWTELGITPRNYILVHYPTSTRPRSDIARIEKEDWNFIQNLSNDTKLKIIIITDTDILPDLNNFITLKTPNINSVIALAKYASYYVGCDSFVAILSCKSLPYNNLFIKTHNPDIYNTLPSHVWLQRFFLPHPYNIIQKFYKHTLSR